MSKSQYKLGIRDVLIDKWRYSITVAVCLADASITTLPAIFLRSECVVPIMLQMWCNSLEPLYLDREFNVKIYVVDGIEREGCC